MPTYRAYRVDERRRILSGDWLEADNDAEAASQAAELCDKRTDAVELWQAARLVKDVDCPDDEDA